MSSFGVHLIVAFIPLIVAFLFSLMFLIGLPSGLVSLNIDFALFGILFLVMLFLFFMAFSLTFILGSLIPDILEPYSLERKMHRGKHHGWGRLNWLNRNCKKVFKIFLIGTGVWLVFMLVLVGLSFLITLPPDVGVVMGTLGGLWPTGCGLVLGFLTGYLIHLKLDSHHPLGLPE